MRMGRVLVGVMLVFVPSILAAQAVETSLRPVLRPAVIEAKFTQTAAPFASLRPKMRPKVSGRSATASAVQKVVVEQTISADITARKVTKSRAVAQCCCANAHGGRDGDEPVRRGQIAAAEKAATQVEGCVLRCWIRRNLGG